MLLKDYEGCTSKVHYKKVRLTDDLYNFEGNRRLKKKDEIGTVEWSRSSGYILAGVRIGKRVYQIPFSQLELIE